MTATFPEASPADAANNVVRGPTNFAMSVGADPATWPNLPAKVREKFLAIRDAGEDARAAATALWDQVFEAGNEATKAKIEFEQRQREIWPKIKPPETAEDRENLPAWYSDRLTRVERLGAEARRLRERYEALTSEAGPLLGLAGRLDRYLKQVAPHFTEAPAVSAELRKGESLAAGIERCRRRARELEADRKKTKVAPWPLAVARAIIERQVDEIAERGRPGVSGAIDWAEPASLTKTLNNHLQHDGTPVYMEGVDYGLMLFWTFREAIKTSWLAALEEEADEANALTDQQRVKRLAEIDRDMLATAREEVEFCRQAGVALRDALDPRAVLGLADNLPAPRDN